MTSKLTRDIIQSEIADFFAGVVEIHTELGGPNTVEEAQNQLTDRVLACVPVVDSEPVYQYQSGAYNDDNGETDWYWDDCDKGFYEQYAHDRRRILYRHAQLAPVVPDDVQRDAKRWRALLGSARIRILGSAGFDATAHPGENPDYRHFGMEIWTHYPNWLHEKNEYGIDTLTQYADAMLAAAPQEVK